MEGLGFDFRDGQIGTVSPTARHSCDVSVLPKRSEMGPSDVRRGRESVQFIISAHEKKGTLGITAKEPSSPSLLLPQ